MLQNETAALSWVSNEKLFERKLKVYDEYNSHEPIPKIASAHGISVREVYQDVHDARAFIRAQMIDQGLDAVNEQVQSHQLAIRTLWHELDDLRLTKPGNKRSATIVKLMHEIGIHEKMIEELVGLRDRRGRILDNPSNPINRDDMIIINPDGTITYGETDTTGTAED